MSIGIIGAGPSGLATSLFLDREVEVLEKADHPGGHASSFKKEGFTFDLGPHIMFSKDKDILKFMVDSLADNVHQSRRNNKISYKSRLIKFPFENDLGSLPRDDIFFCLKHFVDNPYKIKHSNPKNLKEWFLKIFGKGICETYLFPYNEKIWNIPVEELSMVWADRIPNPDSDDVIKSAIGYGTEGYLHQLYYHYPLRGGYQAISDAWSSGCNVTYNFNVVSVTIKNSGIEVTSNNGEKRTFSTLFSTMPVWELAKIINVEVPKEVRAAIDGLICNPMYIVSLGIKGKDKNKFTAIYFPESDFRVNRISYPKTFSIHNAPDGYFSIQADITYLKGNPISNWSDEQILSHTIDGLVERGLIEHHDAVVLTDVKRMPHSYVVYDINYENNTTIIRNWFTSIGIHLIGRFSFFEYINVDGAVDRAIKIVSDFRDDDVTIQELLNIALKTVEKAKSL